MSIVLPLASNVPPSCGVVSSTTFNIPVSVSVSSATTQVLPLYFKILPFDAPDVSTSDNALILAAAIRASALAFVK